MFPFLLLIGILGGAFYYFNREAEELTPPIGDDDLDVAPTVTDLTECIRLSGVIQAGGAHLGTEQGRTIIGSLFSFTPSVMAQNAQLLHDQGFEAEAVSLAAASNCLATIDADGLKILQDAFWTRDPATGDVTGFKMVDDIMGGLSKVHQFAVNTGQPVVASFLADLIANDTMTRNSVLIARQEFGLPSGP